MTALPSTSSAATGRSAALAGIGFMLVAVFLFALNSAAGKWLVAKYPVGEFMLIRSSFTLLFLSPFIWHAGRAAFANAPRPGLQVLRVVLASLEVAMFFWAVSYLPLADTTTFYLAGPIYVTALSVLLLRERVGWRRWTAVLVGFTGVVIALRPSSSSFTLPALIALAGSVIYALVMITTRMLRQTNDIMLMTTYFIGAVAFGARDRAVRLGHADRLRLAVPRRRRLRQYRRAVLRHPLAQARVRERGGALPVHVDRLVRGVRLADVRRTAGRLHDRGRRDHRGGGALYLLARAGDGAQAPAAPAEMP